MAQIVKRKNKNGSTSYLFRVSTGYDRNGKQVTTSRTFTPPPTLTGRKLYGYAEGVPTLSKGGTAARWVDVGAYCAGGERKDGAK